VRFSREIVIVGGSFVPVQVHSFGSLGYVTNYNDELHPLEESPSKDNESPASYPPLGLLGANMEVLA